MKKLIDKLFEKPKDDPFVSLMQVALETPDMRDQLIAVLSLPPDVRTTTIRQWLVDLESQGAPVMLIDAVRFLEDHSRAEKALEILKR